MNVIPLHSRRRGGSARQRQVAATATAFKPRRYFISLAVRMHNLWQRGATTDALSGLGDRQLRDIGVNRTDIRSLVNERHHQRAGGYVDWRRHDPRY